MPASSGTINLNQSIGYLSIASASLNIATQIPVQFPGSAAATAITQLAAGSGAGKYNVAFSVATTTSGTTPIAYDLIGALVGPDGAAAVFADIVLFCISAPSTNTDTLLVGAGTAPVVYFTNALTLYPGGSIIIAVPTATGIPLTATTADKITITSSSGSQSFSLLIAGH